MTGTRAGVLIALALGLLLILGLVAAWVWWPSGPAFDGAALQRFHAELTSGDPARVASVVALPEGAEIDRAFVSQLRSMNLTLDESTITAQDDGLASVLARSGGRSWALVVRAGGPAGWQLLSTVPLG